MYKSQLQVLCQRRGLALPAYDSEKEGPGHCPRFTATVTVNGTLFQSPPSECRSAKEAQNSAAKVAFEFLTSSGLTALPPAPVSPSIPRASSTIVSQQNNGLNIQRYDKINVKPTELLHLYKNRLQQYGQKNNLSCPAYASESDGPPHSRQFKASVTIDRRTYQCSKYYPTLKDAENAAAKMALESLSASDIEEGDGLFKTLLRDLAHNGGYQFPTYSTNKSGLPHLPTFVSTVNVGGLTFQGEECKTKRQSEMSAAKVALEKLSKVAPEELKKSIASPSDTSRKTEDENHQNLGAIMTPKDHLKKIAGGVQDCSSVVATRTDGEGFQHSSTPILGSGDDPDTPQNNNPKPAEKIEFQKGKAEASSTIVTIGPTKEVPLQKGFIPSNDKVNVKNIELLHLYKNRLQQYVQKNHLSHPAYASEFDGPPHCRRFKACVRIDGRTYQCPEYFPNLKVAEHAAAKVALESLSTVEIEEIDGLFETLLQELAQKEGYQFPTYTTNKSGLPHMPNFVSTVEVGGVTYQGEDCKTKKQSEMSAAKVAYEKLIICKVAPEEPGKSIASPQDTAIETVDENCQNFGAKMTPKIVLKRTAGGVEGCSSPVATGTDGKGVVADTLQNNNPKPAEKNEYQKGKAEVKSVEPKLAGDSGFPDSKVLIIHRGSCVEVPKDGPVLHDAEGWMAVKVNRTQQV